MTGVMIQFLDFQSLLAFRRCNKIFFRFSHNRASIYHINISELYKLWSLDMHGCIDKNVVLRDRNTNAKYQKL